MTLNAIHVSRPYLTPRDTPVDLSTVNIAHPSAFVCDITIDPSQVSSEVAHVSNIEYVRWLDRAAELHADSLGFTRSWLVEQGIMWFVARHEIDYLAEVWPQDALVIATWVRDITKVKSWREYVIFRPTDQTVVCRASTLWVLVNLESRRPQRIQPEMIAAFKPLKTDGGTACTSP